uniref:Cuticular protein n=2 Tax=Nilaparvata lugens TaxID=108931 RepID=A0A2S1ZSC8_NILLU|nr:cuticular protein [Nilaparvata lugens]
MTHFKTILASLATLLVMETTAVEYYSYHAESEHYAPARYSFQYAVQDDHTGDVKSQKESREGDSVKGYYTLVQPDGKKRIVEYSADKKTGFVANVRYEGGYAKQVYAPNHKTPAPAPAPKPQPLAVKYLGNKIEEEQPKQDEFNFELSKYESPKFDAFKYGSAKLELPEFKDLATYDFSNFESPKYEAPKFDFSQYMKEVKGEAPKIDFSKYMKAMKVEAPKIDFPQYMKAMKVEAPKIDFSQYVKTAKVEAPKVEEPKANTAFSDVFSQALLNTPYFNY